MPTFDVAIIDSAGVLYSERVDAPTEAQARTRTEHAHPGCAVVSCEIDTSWVARFRSGSARKLDVVGFAQDMATLIGAGVSVKEAIQALIKEQRSEHNGRAQALATIAAEIGNGKSLSEALQATSAFPELLITTISASEETGDLATGLTRYAAHQRNLQTVRDKVIGACIYPALLLSVGTIVVILLLGTVVPKFATLLDGTGKELPALSRMLMAWGHFAEAHPSVTLFMFAALAVGAAFAYRASQDSEVRKKWLATMPLVSNAVQSFQRLQMYRTCAILTSRGITVHKALLHTLEFLNAQDQGRLNVALASMVTGVPMSRSFDDAGLSDGISSSMLSVAENTGELPTMLDRIADFYERDLQRKIDIVTRLIEPVLMIIFGVIIGGIVILMYMPIFDLAANIG